MSGPIGPLELHERMVEEVERSKKADGVYVSDFTRGLQWMQEFVTDLLSRCDRD